MLLRPAMTLESGLVTAYPYDGTVCNEVEALWNYGAVQLPDKSLSVIGKGQKFHKQIPVGPHGFSESDVMNVITLFEIYETLSEEDQVRYKFNYLPSLLKYYRARFLRPTHTERWKVIEKNIMHWDVTITTSISPDDDDDGYLSADDDRLLNYKYSVDIRLPAGEENSYLKFNFHKHGRLFLRDVDVEYAGSEIFDLSAIKQAQRTETRIREHQYWFEYKSTVRELDLIFLNRYLPTIRTRQLGALADIKMLGGNFAITRLLLSEKAKIQKEIIKMLRDLILPHGMERRRPAHWESQEVHRLWDRQWGRWYSSQKFLVDVRSENHNGNILSQVSFMSSTGTCKFTVEFKANNAVNVEYSGIYLFDLSPHLEATRALGPRGPLANAWGVRTVWRSNMPPDTNRETLELQAFNDRELDDREKYPMSLADFDALDMEARIRLLDRMFDDDAMTQAQYCRAMINTFQEHPDTCNYQLQELTLGRRPLQGMFALKELAKEIQPFNVNRRTRVYRSSLRPFNTLQEHQWYVRLFSQSEIEPFKF